MCQAEKDMAVRARDFVHATVGAQVRLTNVRLGKYPEQIEALAERAPGDRAPPEQQTNLSCRYRTFFRIGGRYRQSPVPRTPRY